MPSIHPAHSGALSFNYLHAQPMLWCIFISRIAKASSNVDMPSVLKIDELWVLASWPVRPSLTNLRFVLPDLLHRYVDDILQSTSSHIDQVTIEPDGVWSTHTDSDETHLGGATPASDDDDDDLIEITEPGLPSVKQEPGNHDCGLPSIALERTPAHSKSREASTPSSVVRQSNKKRPVSQVIDLTESGDEDDSPAPPAKRLAPSLPSRTFTGQNYYNPSASSPLNGGSYPPSS